MVKYYIVIKNAVVDKIKYPVFYNCAVVDDDFIIIDDLELYLKNGSGLSSETIDDIDEYFSVDEYGHYKI